MTSSVRNIKLDLVDAHTITQQSPNCKIKTKIELRVRKEQNSWFIVQIRYKQFTNSMASLYVHIHTRIIFLNCRNIFSLKLIRDIPANQSGFPNSNITNDNTLNTARKHTNKQII